MSVELHSTPPSSLPVTRHLCPFTHGRSFVYVAFHVSLFFYLCPLALDIYRDLPRSGPAYTMAGREPATTYAKEEEAMLPGPGQDYWLRSTIKMLH